MCKVSVVTSIYNGEKYIAETIESIIHQTFTDWEYIIIDNASIDASAEIVESYAKRDSRIRFYRNQENIGISANMNQCFDLACGKYIARTDADDLSKSTRLEIQYQYMEDHPDIALVGCEMQYLDANQGRYPSNNDFVGLTSKEVRFSLPFVNFIPASSFFLRKEIIDINNIQHRSYQYSEDYALLLDVLRKGNIYSLPEELISYRLHGNQLTQSLDSTLQNKETLDVQLSFLDMLPQECREIFNVALLGRIRTRAAMRDLGDAILQYAAACDLGNDIAELKKNACIRNVYRHIYYWQKGTIGLLREYMNSPYREPFWYLHRKGISLIKQCVLGEDKLGLQEIGGE